MHFLLPNFQVRYLNKDYYSRLNYVVKILKKTHELYKLLYSFTEKTKQIKCRKKTKVYTIYYQSKY